MGKPTGHEVNFLILRRSICQYDSKTQAMPKTSKKQRSPWFFLPKTISRIALNSLEYMIKIDKGHLPKKTTTRVLSVLFSTSPKPWSHCHILPSQGKKKGSTRTCTACQSPRGATTRQRRSNPRSPSSHLGRSRMGPTNAELFTSRIAGVYQYMYQSRPAFTLKYTKNTPRNHGSMGDLGRFTPINT